MLISRGARVHSTNMGDDTPLHLAAAHGNRDIVLMVRLCSVLILNSPIFISFFYFQLLKHKAEVNFVNEHGNSPLHYATFWNYPAIAEDLVEWGALVNIENKYGETPIDKCGANLRKKLYDRAGEMGQDLRKREFKDLSWLGLKTRSRDATLSRHKGININELYLHTKIAQTVTGNVHSVEIKEFFSSSYHFIFYVKSIFFAGETWQGKWQGNEIAAKVLALRECTPRISRDFNDEYPKLRIFSHPNVMPVIGCCNSPPNLVVISQYVPMGSLYQVLHEGSGLVVDAGKAIQFAIDIAKVNITHSVEIS